MPLNLMIKTKGVRKLSSENKKSQSLFQTSDEFVFIKEYSISIISGSWYYVYKGTILSSFITHSHFRETSPSTNDCHWDQGELQGYIRDFLSPYSCLVSYSQDDAYSQTILFSIKETKTVSSSKEQTSQPKDQFHSISTTQLL